MLVVLTVNDQVDTPAESTPARRAPRLRVVCSWCGIVMRQGDPGAAISHGMCPDCEEDLITSGACPVCGVPEGEPHDTVSVAAGLCPQPEEAAGHG